MNSITLKVKQMIWFFLVSIQNWFIEWPQNYLKEIAHETAAALWWMFCRLCNWLLKEQSNQQNPIMGLGLQAIFLE